MPFLALYFVPETSQGDANSWLKHNIHFETVQAFKECSKREFFFLHKWYSGLLRQNIIPLAPLKESASSSYGTDKHRDSISRISPFFYPWNTRHEAKYYQPSTSLQSIDTTKWFPDDLTLQEPWQPGANSSLAAQTEATNPGLWAQKKHLMWTVHLRMIFTFSVTFRMFQFLLSGLNGREESLLERKTFRQLEIETGLVSSPGCINRSFRTPPVYSTSQREASPCT